MTAVSMTKDHELIKAQRDRFLAFAFAGADFLIEIDQDGKIAFSSGATKYFTGKDDNGLLKTDYCELFSPNDVSLLKTMHGKAKPGVKQEPYLVSMKNTNGEDRPNKVFISGFRMILGGPLYMSISKADNLLRVMGFEKGQNEPAKIADAQDFEKLIRQKIPELIASGTSADVTLVELAGLKDQRKQMDENSWNGLMQAIAQVVMDASLDGQMAAELKDGQYVLLQNANSNSDELQKKIKSVAEQYKLGDVLDIQSKKMEGDLPSLTDREATRAILYTMKKMEEGGLAKAGGDLKQSFKAFLDENTNKIMNLKNIVSRQRFKIHFQPIVDLKTRKVAHHEVLMRFENVASPYELIVLGEDIGIAPDIDLAVCRQALKYADMYKKGEMGKLAVNISGSSIQNEAFVGALMGALREYPSAAKHIMFEITESSSIKELDMVDTFIQQLRGEGHMVCLDDFGAGAASFQYLHKLHVDGVKIDGVYTKSVLTSPRDATMIKNLTQMCHELDVFVVAEFVETEEQSNYLRDIGVDKGQGWLYGKAEPDVLPLSKTLEIATK